jgi:hypothetical protein
VGLLRSGSTAGNPTRKEPLPSVDDIAAIAELERREDAIMMAQDKIECLDNLSLEGDVPDDVSDSGENREKALFSTS